MAYINREQVCENCNNKNCCENEKCPVYKVPTADVVPKSEVEKWKEINEQLYREMSERISEERKIERKLVAREIFEEIENNVLMIISDETFAELKNKYTEGER